MNKKLFLIVLSVFLLIPTFSYAICEGDIIPCGGDKPICEFCHVFELANNIIVYLMTCLAPIVSGVMLILGGFYFMIAGVDPSKMNKAKEVVTAAIVGLIVIFVSWVILNTFLSSMEIAEWTGLGTWWEFKCD